MNTRTFTRSLGTLAVAAFIFAVGTAQGATFTWTGGGDVGNWEDVLNWQSGSVPNSVGGQLSTASSTDVVTFDSETAISMITDSILTRTSWTGGVKNPQIQILNGSVTFSTGLNWGWNGISFVVGDGDMTTLAVADTGYTELNRDPGGLKTYVVNADGTLVFRNNISSWSNDGSSKKAVIQINGGTVRFDGTINNRFTNATDNFVSFEDIDSLFTADFGGQLPDIATIEGQFGDSFKDTTGWGLLATDNLDGSFTISVAIPEPSTVVLAGLGLMGVCFRRRRK